MRRTTAGGLSALALCAVIGTSAGAAHADTTVGQGYGFLAGDAGQAGAPSSTSRRPRATWTRGMFLISNSGSWHKLF